MRQNQWALFSGQQLASAYALEADAFGAIAMTPSFNSLISQFNDYDDYLKGLRNDPAHQQIVGMLSKNNGIIDTAVPTKELVQLFCQAQIAACSELFNGWKISSSQLNRNELRALVERASAGIINIPQIPVGTPVDQYSDSQRQLLSGINVIQNVDTVRVLQILKLLGLTSTLAKEHHQLSLGVGNGYRDLYGIHLNPKITMVQEGSSVKLHFETQERQAAHTVLVDNDPIYKDHFEALNQKEERRVLALNSDAEKSLEVLAKKQEGSGLKQRNLVVCLRIDHHMIPDSKNFIHLIGRVIDSNADLIMTIGAGNNLTEFEGRLQCFDEMSAYLAQIGLKPIRILLHGKGSSAEQRNRPNFGQLAYTSYQILYCSLDRNRII
ncbi:MAG: hypothetical protein P8N11_12035 [Gammaproteobacteria bacterium]|nr:hypothetical protein [Gammaproteobacteria bacterium]